MTKMIVCTQTGQRVHLPSRPLSDAAASVSSHAAGDRVATRTVDDNKKRTATAGSSKGGIASHSSKQASSTGSRPSDLRGRRLPLLVVLWVALLTAARPIISL